MVEHGLQLWCLNVCMQCCGGNRLKEPIQYQVKGKKEKYIYLKILYIERGCVHKYVCDWQRQDRGREVREKARGKYLKSNKREQKTKKEKKFRASKKKRTKQEGVERRKRQRRDKKEEEK